VLEEVVDHAYDTLRAIIPYDRIGFSLLEDDGDTVRARYARAEGVEIHLKDGYGHKMEGSSLQNIMYTGQPRIINDLEATAWSVPILGPDQVATLKDGRSERTGSGAVLAPGTGLGAAGLFWDGSTLHPFPSEGGHTEFAPANEREWGLQMALASRFGHVSWERVVSGPGLISIHRYLADRARAEPAPGCPLHSSSGEDPGPPAITRAARTGDCPVCVETMDQFCRSLGVKAGDLALTLLATRGLWIAGGIAPDALDLLRRGAFLEGFMSKGRLSSLMADLPVYVILDEQAPLLGAGRCAFHHLEGD